MLSATVNVKKEQGYWVCPSCTCVIADDLTQCPNCRRIIPKMDGLRKNRNLRITWHWLR